MIVKSAMKNTAIVGGGGAVEMELSRFLREYSRTVAGKRQRVIEHFARALEVIPRTLVQNSGGDSTEIMNKLRKKHATGGGAEGRWWGVDCIENDIKDTMNAFIWEPATVKENALASATEVGRCMTTVAGSQMKAFKDTMHAFIWEPATVKENALASSPGGRRGGQGDCSLLWRAVPEVDLHICSLLWRAVPEVDLHIWDGVQKGEGMLWGRRRGLMGS